MLNLSKRMHRTHHLKVEHSEYRRIASDPVKPCQTSTLSASHPVR